MGGTYPRRAERCARRGYGCLRPPVDLHAEHRQRTVHGLRVLRRPAAVAADAAALDPDRDLRVLTRPRPAAVAAGGARVRVLDHAAELLAVLIARRVDGVAVDPAARRPGRDPLVADVD